MSALGKMLSLTTKDDEDLHDQEETTGLEAQLGHTGKISRNHYSIASEQLGELTPSILLMYHRASCQVHKRIYKLGEDPERQKGSPRNVVNQKETSNTEDQTWELKLEELVTTIMKKALEEAFGGYKLGNQFQGEVTS